jgi:hypothetical protein
MAEIEGVERQLERLEEALAAGLRLVQLRDKGLPPAQRMWFAEAVRHLTQSHGALLVINDDAGLARRIGADGLHLSPRRSPPAPNDQISPGSALPATRPTRSPAPANTGWTTRCSARSSRRRRTRKPPGWAGRNSPAASPATRCRCSRSAA